ncbi:MAG TPA: acyl-CoA dehydrogenase family protein [Acidimicrobiales bacterium]|nr:acyl-CoA dehydrogenase family protein [Acidimicrobiales bacterium]
MSNDTDVEPVEEFRARLRAWLPDNLPPEPPGAIERTDERWAHERVLQRRLWDGGFAGIRVPREYGGLGLTAEHTRAFNEETAGYDLPFSFNVPTLGILAATLLDAGTHEQKLRHVPAILKGEELWVQFLSEPSGGSDLAGCLTRADRDGDVFVLNGSKIWSSGAYSADYAMCLARTNWDVPKHRGLTMFIVKIHQPGVTVEQIRQTDGSTEFCQEFFDDVPIPATDVVGEVDDGWSVANRLLVHERMAVGGGSPYTAGRSSKHEVGDDESELVELIRSRGLERSQHARLLLADASVRTMVRNALVERVTVGMTSGAMPGSAGSVIKLYGAETVIRRSEIALELAGEDAIAWPAGTETPGARLGVHSLGRQGGALGGGSNEIQRNIISERLLGMPREAAADRDIPYRDVRRSSGR